MNKSGIHPTIVVLALAAIHSATAPAARAQEQSREDAINLLTNGIWHFAGSNWSNDRVFERKGTVLVRASNASGVIKWKMDSKQVTITFPDHQDVLLLPIDPKGTKGMDAHGNDVVATLVPGSSTGEAGPPSALSALHTSSLDGNQSQTAVSTRLTSKKWRFDGANWTETRAFDPDGTMTVENTTRTAHWQVSSDKIIMSFKDHKDILFLPLDPKGTKGQDEYGRLFIATQVTNSTSTAGTTAPASPVAGSGAAPATGSSYFGTSNQNGPAGTPQPSPSAP